MVMTIMLAALTIGGVGAGTALVFGAAWWMVLLSFVAAGNLACFAAIGLAFLRSAGDGPDRRQPERVRANAGTLLRHAS